MDPISNYPDSAPLLSVLVPTYNFALGLRRIVTTMGDAVHDPAIEIRVHDDSTDDRVANEIETIVRSCGRGIYRRNQLASGAVPNWNGLLDAASGEYSLLMHHDEYFESPKVLQDALDVLRDDIDIDGLVFPCRAVSASYPRGRLHMPTRLARFIVNACPGYMLRRNALGPPSTLLLRRMLYPRYDERLKWMVDCELYVRAIVLHRPKLVFLSGNGVMHNGAGALSITASLGPAIKRIHAEELRLLQEQGLPPARGAWLVSTSVIASLARTVEALVWAAFRGAERLTQLAMRRRFCAGRPAEGQR